MRGCLHTLPDDGEKFGLWQGTHELCYEEKYLDKLLSTLLQGGVEINYLAKFGENKL